MNSSSPTEGAAGQRSLLSNSSPNNIPPSKVLCPWLEQGTSGDCKSSSTCQLMDSGSRASYLNVPPDLPQGRLPYLTALPLTTKPNDSSAPRLADLPSTRSPTDLRSSKETRVVDVLRGFSEAEIFSDGFNRRLSRWDTFWSEPEVVLKIGSIPETAFEAGVAQRLLQLKQARHDISKKDWGDTRLWLIFFAHEVEYISQWKHIDLYTSRGVDSMSAAIKIAEKYLKTAKNDYRRGKNIVQVMKEGGPALVLEDGGLPQSKWEKFLALDDITYIFTYIRKNIPGLDEQAKLNNPKVSHTILDGFKKYGWSLSELLGSNTKVMVILRPYITSKRLYADNGRENSEPQCKRSRVNQSRASVLLPGFLASSLDLGSNDFDQGTLSRNTMESTPGSFDATNRRRDLIDLTTAGNLSYAVNGLDKFMDPATVNNLAWAVNNPATTSNLSYYRTNQLVDASVVEFLQCTANGSDKLTDPSTDRFLQGAISASQLYLTDATSRSIIRRQPERWAEMDYLRHGTGGNVGLA